MVGSVIFGPEFAHQIQAFSEPADPTLLVDVQGAELEVPSRIRLVPAAAQFTKVICSRILMSLKNMVYHPQGGESQLIHSAEEQGKILHQRRRTGEASGYQQSYFGFCCHVLHLRKISATACVTLAAVMIRLAYLAGSAPVHRRVLCADLHRGNTPF